MYDFAMRFECIFARFDLVKKRRMHLSHAMLLLWRQAMQEELKTRSKIVSVNEP
jgi:hypothetical protein